MELNIHNLSNSICWPHKTTWP